MPEHLTKNLPSYTSLANATSAGLVSGDFFVLTDALVGVLTLNLVVRVP